MPLTKVKSGGVSDSITLTSPDINAPDIDGGTIDNAVIGGSTAAAGSFTTITATGGSSSNWNTAYGWGDHSTQSYATQTYVGTEVSNLVDSSPAALDTLNELAAALGDDPNFATTVTNSIALKAPLANPSFTGTVTADGGDFSGQVQFNGTSGIQLDNAAQAHTWTLDDNFTSRLNIGTSSGSAAWKIGSNNNAYLTVSPTGIDVTGTATMDGLTVDTAAPFMSFKESGATKLFIGESSAVGGGAGYYDFYAVTGLGQRFFTNSVESLRISSAGHTMFATNDDAPGAGNTQSGVAIRGGSDNRSFFSANSNYVAAFNRNTNDGPIVEFNKNGTTVGIIGTNAATMFVAAPQAGGMKYSYYDSTNAVMLPVTTTGANADATHDLGYASARFRDLYLSSGVYLGGTGSANKLDDYEQGTWTPVISGGTYTYSNRRGHYVKIGNMVYAHVGLRINTATSVSSSTASITGLPFIGASFGSYQEPMSRIDAGGGFVTSNLGTQLSFYLSSNTAVMYGRTTVTNADSPIAGSSVWQNGTFIKLKMIYTVS